MQKNNKVPQIRFAGFTDDWEQRKLGEIGTTFSGLTGKSKDDFGHGKAKYVTYLNVHSNCLTSDEMLDLIEIDDAQNQVQKGDVFFTTSSEVPDEVGLSSVWTYDISNVYLNSFCFAYRPNEKIDLNYLAYMLRSKNVRNQMILLAQGISRYNISKKSVMEINVYLPKYEEQTAIGNFFKQLDETIALHQREYEKYQNLKKSYLEKMFPKENEQFPEIRFPEFTDAWEQRKLGEIMEITSVKRVHQSDWTAVGVRFLRARDLVALSKNEEIEEPLYISTEQYEKYSIQSGKVSKGDLLVTGVGTIGVPMLVDTAEPIYFKDGNVIWFKNGEKINGNFLYYSFTAKTIQDFINNVAGIGTVGTYTIDNGKKTPISLPTLAEQAAIGNFFKQLDETIALHQRKIEKYQFIKRLFWEKMFIKQPI